VLVRNGLDLSEANPRERTATLDAVKEIMAEAVEWQALFFELVSGPDPGEQGRKGAIARLVSSLKELCEASRTAKGPAVLLESFDRQPYAKNRLIGATQDAVQVARAVASYYPRFGLLLDLSHLPLLSESPPDAVAKAADYLKHVHIGNCVTRYPDHPAYGDEHPPFGIEEGENGPEQLAAFLRALLDVGYLREGSPNAVSFDVKPLKQEDVGKVLDSCKKTFEAAWRMV
jgi:sugar phosphate isomerase/epimerase